MNIRTIQSTNDWYVLELKNPLPLQACQLNSHVDWLDWCIIQKKRQDSGSKWSKICPDALPQKTPHPKKMSTTSFRVSLTFFVAMAVLLETNLGDIVIDLKVRREGTFVTFFHPRKQAVENVSTNQAVFLSHGGAQFVGSD